MAPHTPITATAPGKIILFGEHAVVYGQPAIAAPLTQLQATATIEPLPHQNHILLRAPDFGQEIWLHQAPTDHPLGAAVRIFQTELRQKLPPLRLTVSSTIPIASGLGSGAAIAAALIRALAHYLHRPDLAQPAIVSRLTYQVEQIHHGTPSGIDNTVVSHETPVYFVRHLAQAAPDIHQRLRQANIQLPTPTLQPFASPTPLHLLIADTGITAPTKTAVSDVRHHWLADEQTINPLFIACGHITQAAHTAIKRGDVAEIGALMERNQRILKQLTVSSPELETLISAAMAAGALGAKLSGGGRGGNMIALIAPPTAETITTALYNAGAKHVWKTTI